MPWGRYAVSYCQPHCEEDTAVYLLVHLLCTFINVFIKKNVLSRDGLYEWDMLPIKILKKEKIPENNKQKDICCELLPATISLKMPIVKKTCCVLLPLSFMKSFKMKICCVLRPASLWRRYSCVLLISSSAVYFYQCVYQKLCLRCQVPSPEGLYEWDMLPIKILKKERKQQTEDHLEKRRHPQNIE